MKALRAFVFAFVLGWLGAVIPSCSSGSSPAPDAGCTGACADGGSGRDGGAQDAGQTPDSGGGNNDAGQDGGGFCVPDNFACTPPGQCCSGNCPAVSGICEPQGVDGGGLGDGGCFVVQHFCQSASDCCSGDCNTTTGRCTLDGGFCFPDQSSCTFNLECCSNFCDTAGTKTCVEGDAGCLDAGVFCIGASQCCSKTCSGFKCG